MPTPVFLPHGKTLDLDSVTVIRSVSENESTRFNNRAATLPGSSGVVSDRGCCSKPRSSRPARRIVQVDQIRRDEAGAKWEDAEVVIDQGIVTLRNSGDPE